MKIISILFYRFEIKNYWNLKNLRVSYIFIVSPLYRSTHLFLKKTFWIDSDFKKSID